MGARFRERHSKVARVFVAGSRKIASERGLGARSKGRSRWERRYGSDTSESLAVSTKRSSKKKMTRSDVLERHLEVAPAQSEVSRATLQGRLRFSQNTTRGNDSGATSPSDTLTSLPNRSRHLELKNECLEWSLGEQGMGATSLERHHQVALITLLERPNQSDREKSLAVSSLGDARTSPERPLGATQRGRSS
ncbi:hypothetical protein YC2023_035875 [Brassica napus]